jgi:hypothetical protein
MLHHLQVITREVAPRHRIQQPIQPGSTPRGETMMFPHAAVMQHTSGWHLTDTAWLCCTQTQ